MRAAMEMSAVLQVAMFFASVAIVVLVACILPIMFHMRRRLENLTLAAEALVHDSREMVRNVNELTKRAHQQMDDTAKILHTVQEWTARADRLVDEVGSAIESPVFTLVRNMNRFRTGAATFLQMLFQNNNKPKQENDHV